MLVNDHIRVAQAAWPGGVVGACETLGACANPMSASKSAGREFMRVYVTRKAAFSLARKRM